MNDKTNVRAVIIALAVSANVAIASGTFIVYQLVDAAKDSQVALMGAVAGLTGLAGTCVGALGALLASTRSTTPEGGTP